MAIKTELVVTWDTGATRIEEVFDVPPGVFAVEVATNVPTVRSLISARLRWPEHRWPSLPQDVPEWELAGASSCLLPGMSLRLTLSCDAGHGAVAPSDMPAELGLVPASPFFAADPSLDELRAALDKSLAEVREIVDKRGAVCTRCNLRNEYAAPSPAYVCFECRR